MRKLCIISEVIDAHRSSFPIPGRDVESIQVQSACFDICDF